MTTPPKDPHKDLPAKARKWVEEFKRNVERDFTREDLNKIRKAMTWREKLQAGKLMIDAQAIGREKDPQKQLEKVRKLMPQVEKLLTVVERGTGKKLDDFGKYLPDEAKTETVRNALRHIGAHRLAGMVDAHIPPKPPTKADRFRPVLRRRPMAAPVMRAKRPVAAPLPRL